MIKASINEKMKYFRCSNGHINECACIEDINQCQFCDSRELLHVPIFVKKYTNLYLPDDEVRATEPHDIYVNIDSKKNYIPKDNKKECPKCGNLRLLKSSNPNFPIRSLYWKCPNPDCEQIDDFRNPASKQNLFYFKPDYPYDNLFWPLTVRLTDPFDFTSLHDAKRILDTIMEHIKDIKFSNQMIVYDLCYGTVASKKFFHFEDNHKRILYTRKFNTKGLIIEFDESLYSKIKESLETDIDKISNPDIKAKLDFYLKNELEMRIAILHTLKHLILFELPMIVGIEPNKISGDYSIDENSVYIFDNESGGIGVCETIRNDLQRFGKLFSQVKERAQSCKRDPYCNGACKLCVYIENCGNINHYLNRYLLFPMFRLDFNELE